MPYSWSRQSLQNLGAVTNRSVLQATGLNPLQMLGCKLAMQAPDYPEVLYCTASTSTLLSNLIHDDYDDDAADDDDNYE